MIGTKGIKMQFSNWRVPLVHHCDSYWVIPGCGLVRHNWRMAPVNAFIFSSCDAKCEGRLLRGATAFAPCGEHTDPAQYASFEQERNLLFQHDALSPSRLPDTNSLRAKEVTP